MTVFLLSGHYQCSRGEGRLCLGPLGTPEQKVNLVPEMHQAGNRQASRESPSSQGPGLRVDWVSSLSLSNVRLSTDLLWQFLFYAKPQGKVGSSQSPTTYYQESHLRRTEAVAHSGPA